MYNILQACHTTHTARYIMEKLGLELSPSNTKTAREDTFTSDLMASMVAPNFSVPSELHPPANQSPRFGSTASRQGIHSTHRVFSLHPGAGHPWNQQGFETRNFHQKNVWNRWNLRSSVIHRSVHIARPTFSTTSLYSGCYHVTTSQTNTSRRWWLLWHLKKGRKYGTSSKSYASFACTNWVRLPDLCWTPATLMLDF